MNLNLSDVPAHLQKNEDNPLLTMLQQEESNLTHSNLNLLN